MSNQTIVLAKYMRIGDRVRMAMEAEARGWGRQGVPDGTLGTVIGFTRYETHISRVGDFGRKPGQYMANGGAVIAWDTGAHDVSGGHDLQWAENAQKLEVIRREDKAWNDAFDVKQFIAPLPDLPFWEHDIVRDKTGRVTMGDRTDGKLRIARIKYENLNAKRDDGSPMPIYDVEAPEGRSGYTWTNNDDLELIERGKVWKYFNDRENLKFESLTAEAAFFQWLGNTTEVRNPRTETYHWPMEDVYFGLTEGHIDVIQSHAGFFGSGPSMHGYRFQDRDLGERIRAESLKGGWPK